MMPPTQVNDKAALLDKLDIELICLEDLINTSPSSGTGSLRTPAEATNELFPTNVFRPQSYCGSSNVPYQNMPTPAAPLMKDMDSFSQGSREGSFGFLSEASVDEYDESCRYSPVPSRAPSPGVAIERWRENVSNNDALLCPFPSVGSAPEASGSHIPKRSRSPASEDGRRIRPRAQSQSSSVRRSYHPAGRYASAMPCLNQPLPFSPNSTQPD